MLPLTYMGNGQFQTPKGFVKRADAELAEGETMKWEIAQERSGASHRHYFALIEEAWANLPEGMAEDFPNPDSLRKWALIKAGFCTVVKIVCEDQNEANTAKHSMLNGTEGYKICTVSNNVLTIYTAMSQRKKAMGAEAFQKSKDATLQIISELLEIDVTELGKAA